MPSSCLRSHFIISLFVDERNCPLKRKQQCLNWAMKNDLKGTEIDGIRQGKVLYITVRERINEKKGTLWELE